MRDDPIRPELGGEPSVVEGTVWRIATWNVHGSARPDLHAVAAVLRDLRPDAVAVQEVQHGQARELARILGWQRHWARKHFPYTPLVWWLAEGLAVLSPHRLERRRRRSVSPGVSSWTHRHRIVLASTVVRPDDRQRLRLYDVHLAAHASGADARIEQAGRVTAMAVDEGLQPRVIAGDLNDAAEPEVVRAFRPAGVFDPGGGPTNPAVAPRQRLDHVLVPDGAEVTAVVEVAGGDDWQDLSDHLPVLVEFRCAPSTDAAPSR